MTDERHVSLYGDGLGNWLTMVTPTGTIPPPEIILPVYDGQVPPPYRTLCYLSRPELSDEGWRNLVRTALNDHAR